MRWSLLKRYILLLVVAAVFGGCTGDDYIVTPYKPPVEKHEPKPQPEPEPEPEPEPDPDPEELELTSFVFRKAENAGRVSEDVKGVIDGDEVTVFLPDTESAAGLVPAFTGSFHNVTVGDEVQQNRISAHDFSRPLFYTLVDSHGYQRTYRVTVKVASGLPMVRITTDGGRAVSNKTEFIDGDIEISNIPEYGGNYTGGLQIRGRGNATWTDYPKKPYRIKLDKKASLFGFPEHKDWALLAEYCDKSLMRTSYMWEVSKIAGSEWTCRGRHVELWLNGTFLGTYLLCENANTGDERADLAPDGFMIESDNYYSREPVWFRSDRGLNFTFKYPDARDGEITTNDNNYKYITGFISEMEAALYGNDFRDPAKGYRKYIDARSFARWYLVQEVIGNVEPNPYFILETRGAKLKMYPGWDAEWSLGLATKTSPGAGWSSSGTSPVDRFYWKNNLYFTRLIQDPWFCDLLRSEWEAMKTRMPEFEANITAITRSIEHAQARNFKKWNILGRKISVGLVWFDTWEKEAGYVSEFFDKRKAWLDKELKSY